MDFVALEIFSKSAAGRLVQGGFPIFLNKPDLQKARWAKPLSVDKSFTKAFDCLLDAMLEMGIWAPILKFTLTVSSAASTQFSSCSSKTVLYMTDGLTPITSVVFLQRCLSTRSIIIVFLFSERFPGDAETQVNELNLGICGVEFLMHDVLPQVTSEIPNEILLWAWGSEFFSPVSFQAASGRRR